jgi:flagellar motor switch protein FliG
MEMKNLSGSVKVAILTNAIGLTAAEPILSRMDDEERRLIYRLQSKLGSVPEKLVEKVAQEFLTFTGMAPAVTPETKDAELDQPQQDNPESMGHERHISNLKAIQNIGPAQLLQLIKDEHPQTIALILVNLKASVASDILGMLSEEIKADVAFRIANLDKVISGMVEEIDKVFEEILKNKDQSAIQEAGGVGRLAEILNQIDGGSVEQIIDEIEENDPDLADEIKQMMFVFEDVVLVDDKGLQKVLRNVESQELAIALKAASEDVKTKIFKNMSERAAEILKEEMEVSGAVRMKDVTDAQQKVTRIIQEMERKGELIISGRGGEEFIG